MDILSATQLPWLAAGIEQMRRDLEAGRVPHAILILSPPGLGAERLADWIGAAALCESAAGRPCGSCPSCHLLTAGNHPDLYRLQREEKAQQLKVEQVRELIEALALTSYRGRGKAGIVEEADTLNVSGANAFLKTLEEPAPGTVLVLVAQPQHRLPMTIASRCRKIVLRAPTGDVARAWLASHAGSEGHFEDALAIGQGAPLAALDIGEARAAQIVADVRGSLAQLEQRAVDPSWVAWQWAQGDTGLRLAWLENSITSRVRQSFAEQAGERSNAGTDRKSAEPVVLSPTLLKAKIRGLLRLLDDIRELRRLLSTSASVQLALETLLLKHFVAE